MLPIKDNVRRYGQAWVTKILVALNTLVFLYQITLPEPALMDFLNRFALVPARFFGPMRDVALGDWLAFLTNMFLHGGLLHLVMNMWTLWIFGPSVEDRLGGARYLTFYLLCGLAASWTHAAVNWNSMVPTLGASGAISGVMGCYVRLFPRSRIYLMVPMPFWPLFVAVPALAYAAFWFLSQIVPGLVSLLFPSEGGGVAWWAHIGGFVAGWYLLPFIRRSRRLDGSPEPGRWVYVRRLPPRLYWP